MFFEGLVLGEEEGGGFPPLASRQLRRCSFSSHGTVDPRASGVCR